MDPPKKIGMPRKNSLEVRVKGVFVGQLRVFISLNADKK